MARTRGTHSARTAPSRRSPAVEDVAVEAAALELQRAMVVARMMGVAPEWAAGPAAAPGWWLETWAGQLARERLSPALRDTVLAWLDRVHDLLEERHEAVARPDLLQDWLDGARETSERGFELEALVLVEVSSREA